MFAPILPTSLRFVSSCVISLHCPGRISPSSPIKSTNRGGTYLTFGSIDESVENALIRAPASGSEKQGDSFEVHIVEQKPISSERLEEIKVETEKDATLQSLSQTVKEGWPRSKDQIGSHLNEYWQYRDEITIESK
ncbi:hypothetical protein HOLleu_44176 [Holothuria leucospilota]|uniref:Uncharacterized protein n=1 Tax=Holothuria leucospilota TaxID=206669 RepID=A0A9Q1BAL7_HOLLE|nr:hypothetical protein HOLleu_44176 [Holothuria leucospilota]